MLQALINLFKSKKEPIEVKVEDTVKVEAAPEPVAEVKPEPTPAPVPEVKPTKGRPNTQKPVVKTTRKKK